MQRFTLSLGVFALQSSQALHNPVLAPNSTWCSVHPLVQRTRLSASGTIINLILRVSSLFFQSLYCYSELHFLETALQRQICLLL